MIASAPVAAVQYAVVHAAVVHATVVRCDRPADRYERVAGVVREGDLTDTLEDAARWRKGTARREGAAAARTTLVYSHAGRVG